MALYHDAMAGVWIGFLILIGGLMGQSEPFQALGLAITFASGILLVLMLGVAKLFEPAEEVEECTA
jgi:formate/nitrite transporter FocA (FNT family)